MYSGPGTWLGINICYGLAVTLAVYVSGRVSGGHINPAVSMAEAVRGSLAWKDLPFYITSQVLFLIIILKILTFFKSIIMKILNW